MTFLFDMEKTLFRFRRLRKKSLRYPRGKLEHDMFQLTNAGMELPHDMDDEHLKLASTALKSTRRRFPHAPPLTDANQEAFFA